MSKCGNPHCPVCYPNRREEEATAKKRAEDDPNQRMAFVLRAAERFHNLLQDPLERHSVENSIRLIAPPR